MDKFVKDAFEAADSIEYAAFRRMILANQEILMKRIAQKAGKERVYELSTIIVSSGYSETFAAFIGETIMMAFTAGWTGAKEQYLGEDLK